VTNAAPPSRSPLAFFAVVLALAIPIWLASRFVGVIGSLKIPITDLMLGFTPLTAAIILIWRQEGAGGVVTLLKRAVDIRGLTRTRWFGPVIGLAPLVYGVTYLILHLAGHGGTVEPHVLRLPFMAAIIFLLAIGEEGGWTGYLIDPLQARFGALGASLIIAVPWWLGHLPSIAEIGGTASDMAWWFPGAIALRILITWLYNNSGGALAAAVLFHTVLNVARLASYPTIGTHYDPVYQAMGYAIFSILAVIVVAVWGARTLTRGAGRV
jgi:membrane protease YdiL (CAAX protease family)